MSTDAFVDFLEGRFAPNVASHTVMEATAGDFVPLPGDLAPPLAQALQQSGMTQLYSHQHDAYQSIRAGKDTVLVSRTASGKTLSFLLPILPCPVYISLP